MTNAGLSRSFRSIALAALAVLTFGLCACGSGNDTVASIGSTKITRTMLDHWMGAVVGTDYTTELTGAVPAGLVSDPPHYDRCVSAARGFVRKVAGKPTLSTAQIRVKCRQLNAAIKEQALAFILASLQIRAEAAELGIPAPTAAQVTRGVRALAGHDYKSQANFRQTLAKQRRSIADVRFQVATNLIERRVLARVRASVARSGGGERAIFRLLTENRAKWRKRTSCRPGYRALECKLFHPGDEAKPPGVTVLELLGKGVG